MIDAKELNRLRLNLPCLPALTGPTHLMREFDSCPSCGYRNHPEESICEEVDCQTCGQITFDLCPNCGYCEVLDPAWKDAIDPSGRRPDQWARKKGHLRFSHYGNRQSVDPNYIAFAFFDAGTRRLWPNPWHRPDYKISEEAYDAAIASGPWATDASPIRVPLNQMM